MKIIAHRGNWFSASEKNTALALRRALCEDFGVETDLRDFNGTVVISHDSPDGSEMTLDQLLTLCKAHPQCGLLALNIKSDGMQNAIKSALDRHGPLDAFVFDMSVPDAIGFIGTEIRTYTRCSEYENPPPFLKLAAGIWLDSFHSDWYDMDLVECWLHQGKDVCIVSPELHGRAHLATWERL